MRVLVTGHQGYIGVVLTPLLQDAGHEVVGLDSEIFDGCDFGSLVIPEVPSIRKDVRDVTAADLEGFEAVLHLAGVSNDPVGELNAEHTYEINHRATVRLGELAKEAGVPRFVFSSSCSTYGAQGEGLVGEDAPFNPVTAYGESKVLAERDLSALADDRFSPTFLRNATAYGLSPRLRVDLVVNNLTAYALTTGQVKLLSDGASWRPLVHIEDISRAFLCAIEAPREDVHDQAFNVGRMDENYLVRDIADIVADVVPDCAVSFADEASADARSYRVDFAKIHEVLPAFRPQWTVRRGVQELYEAYVAAGLTEDEFLGPRYTRLRHIRELQDAGRLEESLRWVEVAAR